MLSEFRSYPSTTTTAQISEHAHYIFLELNAITTSGRSQNMINLAEGSIEPLRFNELQLKHLSLTPPNLKFLSYCDPRILEIRPSADPARFCCS